MKRSNHPDNVIYIRDYKRKVKEMNLDNHIEAMRRRLEDLYDPEDVLSPIWPEIGEPQLVSSCQSFDGYTGTYCEISTRVEGLVVS